MIQTKPQRFSIPSQTMSGLGSLPRELFDNVLGRLGQDGITRLMSCNSSLQKLLEPFLYSNKAVQNKAMDWACREGQLSTIRLAVTYGASVDLIQGHHSTSTINIAAKKHRGEAIRLLIELGACVVSPEMGTRDRNKGLVEFRRMIRHLCSPHMDPEESESLIQLLYDHAIDERCRKVEQGPDTALPLITLIMSRSGTPFDLIRRLLDEGVDINKPRPYQYRDALTPLSAAILANSMSVFRLLRDRGADIHGVDVEYLPRKGLHIPIFAAAKTMAVEDHGRVMMQLCVDNGADINNRLAVMLRENWYWRPGPINHTSYCYITPLLVFLDSVDSFKSFHRPNPVKQLTWLLVHGARLPSDDHISMFSLPKRHGCIYYGAPTAIDLLIDKWGLQKFSEPRFTEMITLLADQGISRDHVGRLLIKHRPVRNSTCIYTRENKKIDSGREVLTSILLESLDIYSYTDMLTIVIMSAWNYYIPCDCISGSSTPPRKPWHEAIEPILEQGADINARVLGREEGGHTALHELCGQMNKIERSRVESRPFANIMDAVEHLQREIFLEFLIEKGAGPTISVGITGDSALDVLVAGLDQFRIEDAKESIQSLASELREAYEDVVATRRGAVVVR